MSLLSPNRLGYDTTMQLCKVPLTRPPIYVPAFSPLVNLKDYGPSLYNTHWAISMPSKDGTDKVMFITTRALSIARVEVLCGRATLAWAAFNVKDLEGDGPYKVVSSLDKSHLMLINFFRSMFLNNIGDLHMLRVRALFTEKRRKQTTLVVYTPLKMSSMAILLWILRNTFAKVYLCYHRGMALHRASIKCRVLMKLKEENHYEYWSQKAISLQDHKFHTTWRSAQVRNLHQTGLNQ